MLDLAGKNRVIFRLARLFFCVNNEALSVEVTGVRFQNPIVLPAGYSKCGAAIRGIAMLGFGGVIVGSTSLYEWLGNTGKRMIRVPHLLALINRMGLQNPGTAHAVPKIIRSKSPVPVGLSIVPTPNSPDPIADIVGSFRIAGPKVPIVVVDISCPNVKGGKSLQDPVLLRKLLRRLGREVRRLNEDAPAVWVKISRDLPRAQFKRIVDVCLTVEYPLAIVLGNTTPNYGAHGVAESDCQDILSKIDGGGISGKPLFNSTLERTRLLRKLTKGKIPIVACGGISSADEAWKCFRAGASLVEVMTGLVYEGPGLIRRMNKGLLECLHTRNMKSISQAIGREIPI